MSNEDLVPSGDAELWRRLEPEFELVFQLLGPVGAVAQWVQQRILRWMKATEESTGGELKRIVEKARTNEAMADLLREAVEASIGTRLEEKVRAFGRAIAEGNLVNDDALIDLERVIVRTIDVLEAPHLRALEKIDADRTRPAHEVLGHEWGNAADPILIVLVSEGLLRQRGGTMDGNPLYEGLSEYGRRVRQYLLESWTLGNIKQDR